MPAADGLLVLAWLSEADANTLGRIVTDSGDPHKVSWRGRSVAAELCRFGYAKSAPLR